MRQFLGEQVNVHPELGYDSQGSRINDIRSMMQTLQTKPHATHESCFRSYSILQLVKAMLERGDSVETISMVINECEVSDDAG